MSVDCMIIILNNLIPYHRCYPDLVDQLWMQKLCHNDWLPWTTDRTAKLIYNIKNTELTGEVWVAWPTLIIVAFRQCFLKEWVKEHRQFGQYPTMGIIRGRAGQYSPTPLSLAEDVRVALLGLGVHLSSLSCHNVLASKIRESVQEVFELLQLEWGLPVAGKVKIRHSNWLQCFLRTFCRLTKRKLLAHFSWDLSYMKLSLWVKQVSSNCRWLSQLIVPDMTHAKKKRKLHKQAGLLPGRAITS